MLENTHIGDKIYYIPNHSSKRIIATVIRETEKSIIIEGNTKIRRTDGYEIGSTGEGRYGQFSSIYWEPVTPEIEKEEEIKSKFRHAHSLLKDANESKFNSENIDSIIELSEKILKIIQESNKK